MEKTVERGESEGGWRELPVIKLFVGRRPKPQAPEEKPVTDEARRIHKALEDGLARMGSEGVERIVLTVNESYGLNLPKREGWMDAGERKYYPHTILDDEELALMRAGKSYTVISLVNGDVGGSLNRKASGVQVILREFAPSRFLNKMENEADLNYELSVNRFEGDELLKWAGYIKAWTPDMVTRRIDDGIREWHERTAELVGGTRQARGHEGYRLPPPG